MAEVLKRGDWRKGRRRGAAAAFARARPRSFMERFPPISPATADDRHAAAGQNKYSLSSYQMDKPSPALTAGEEGSVDDQALAQAPRQADRLDFAETTDVFRRLGQHDEPFVVFEC